MSAPESEAQSRRAALQAAFDPKARHPLAFALAIVAMIVGLGAFLTPVIFLRFAPAVAVSLEAGGIVLLFAGLATIVIASGAVHPWRQATEYSRIMEESGPPATPNPLAKCPKCGNMNPKSSQWCARCGASTQP
jgi:hypothetical protein